METDEGGDVDTLTGPRRSSGDAEPGSGGLFGLSSRLAKVSFGVVAVLVVAIVVSSFIPVDEYAITPGQARSVVPLISVAKGHANPRAGSVLLTDVGLVPLHALSYLFYKLNSNDDVEPSSAITGSLSSAQYDTEGVIDMASARQAATVAALRTLGYDATATPAGVADYAPTSPDAPATAVLAVGDVITRIDRTPTLSDTALAAALRDRHPGTPVSVTFHVFGSTRTTSATVTLGVERTSTALGYVCTKTTTPSSLPYYLSAGNRVPCLGIQIEPLFSTVHAPFAVSMNAEGIIGPSAGLAFTLGLISKLDAANLTGGAIVAATGTMSLDGSVGDVGGVAQKTIAVRNAGATLFFVPTSADQKIAERYAGFHLTVIAVSNLSQAIAVLEKRGGRVVRPGSR